MYQCKSSSGQTEGKKWSISGLVLKHRTLNTSCLLIRISIRFPSVPSTLVSCSQHSKIDLRLQACDHCCVILLPQLFPLLFLLTACKSAFKKNNKRIILQNKRSQKSVASLLSVFLPEILFLLRYSFTSYKHRLSPLTTTQL